MAKLNFDEIEKKLADRSMSADELRKLAVAVTPLKPFKPGDVFPIGIVDPDGVRVRVTVPKAEIGKFVTDMSGFRDAIVRSWRVFPIGIIDPDRFEVDVDIGRPFR